MKSFICGLLILTLLFPLAFSGCSKGDAMNNDHTPSDSTQGETPNTSTEGGEKILLQTVEMTVNGKIFTVTLTDNQTAKAFAEALPLTLEMNELNGNEKYHYLDGSLPSAASAVGNITCGDLMLYGSDCIVLFYKSFATSYSYTRIGSIDDVEGLEQSLGTQSATVTFKIN
ncbi:MAG: cyclophilin-like fold protein [Candidatus Coproplasma sp.]